MKCLVCDSPLAAGRCENPACALFLAGQPRLVVRLDGPRIIMAIEDGETPAPAKQEVN